MGKSRTCHYCSWFGTINCIYSTMRCTRSIWRLKSKVEKPIPFLPKSLISPSNYRKHNYLLAPLVVQNTETGTIYSKKFLMNLSLTGNVIIKIYTHFYCNCPHSYKNGSTSSYASLSRLETRASEYRIWLINCINHIYT